MYISVLEVYYKRMDTITDPDCANCGHAKSEHDYHGDCDWQNGTENCDCDEFVADEE